MQRRAQGATRERMLRELVEGLDALTVDSPLVLVLEDLHWSDSATIDLLAMLARRREPSRLLVLGTYRPADVAVSDHPLKAAKRELELHAQCEEIPLEFLSVKAVAEYLSRRFAQQEWPAEFPRMLHRRTDGNPLFLVNTIDDLLAQGQLREVDGQWALSAPVKDLALDAPETLWQMVEKQIERLTPDEQALLAVASVAGAEFSAAIATADGIGVRGRRTALRGAGAARPVPARDGRGRVAGWHGRRPLCVHPCAVSARALRARPDRAPGGPPSADGRAPRAGLRPARGRDRRRARHALRGGPGLRAGRAVSPSGGRDRPAPARLPRGGRPSDAGAGPAEGAAGLRRTACSRS